MPSISAALIVRDELEHIGRAIASIRPHVDEVCVYDTGSTDGTLELLDKLAAQPGPPIRVTRGEWRDDFAWARTQSFAMVNPETAWILWLDADDELTGGHHLRHAITPTPGNVGLLTIYYEYDTDQDGEPVFGQWRRSLVRTAAGYTWKREIHEYLQHHAGTAYNREQRLPDERVRLVHRSTKNSTPRNLRMLHAIEARSSEAGTAAPAWTLDYLAGTYLTLRDWPHVRHYAHAILNSPDADTDLKSRAHTLLGDCALAETSRPEEAAPHYQQALTISPHNQHALVGLANCKLSTGDTREAKQLARQALTIPDHQAAQPWIAKTARQILAATT